jgi:hypothetical protein
MKARLSGKPPLAHDQDANDENGDQDGSNNNRLKPRNKVSKKLSKRNVRKKVFSRRKSSMNVSN